MSRGYLRVEDFHDAVYYRLEYREVHVVIDAFLEREVERAVPAVFVADVCVVAGSREEVLVMRAYFELVQRASEDSVGSEEGFFHAVAVVHIYVDVEDALVLLEQLEDREHAIVHVAEARRFLPLRVVQASRPVYRDVDRALVD